jgi:hypothetical protein
MKLYHVSTKASVQSVLTRGLLPGTVETGTFDEHTSPHNLVYMSRFINLPYLLREHDAIAHVFEIESDRIASQENLCPDDEQLAEQLALDKYPSLDPESDEARKIIYDIRNGLDMRASHPLWRNFVNSTGTCAHIGQVSPEAIERHSNFSLPSLRPLLENSLGLISSPATTPIEALQILQHLTSVIMRDTPLDLRLALGHSALDDRLKASVDAASSDITVSTWHPPLGHPQ